jgi:DNA polymerase-3 subunit alpha
MVRPFVHTHVHSDYSLLDGAAKIPDLVAAAARFEQPALALTDHGNLCGSIEFYKACRAAGVKPILGIEAYLAPRSRFDREKNPVAAHHVILLAMNATGWKNLIKLSTRSFTEGFYYVPRMDKELLARHHEGLIAQSACLSGEPAYYARHDDVPRAARAASEMRDIFGDRYYLELQRNGCEGQEKVNQALMRIAAAEGIPVVATNDVHYVGEGDAPAHEVHMCIGMGKTLSDAKRLKPESLLCFRAADPMFSLFPDVEAAPRATEEIASRCDLNLDLGTLHLPAFEAPGGEDPAVFFARLCREGARERYGDPLPEAVERRLEHERGVIQQMGFVPYFLITWDFVRFAKREGIPVGPGRGSSAGSLVAYSLGITNVDPLKYDLLFERFLNPERVSMPDFDIDFCRDGRERVIHYVREKYGGPERVSQIITFGTMAARAVIRDVGRVMGVPLRDVDALAKKVPNGPKATLEGALDTDPDLRAEVDRNPEYRRLIDVALRLEGLNRNASKHAAGVVIADAPLEEYVPLYKVGDDLTTQFTMDVLEDVGLLKMDFLGLRTLTILAKALENVRKGGGEPPDLDRLPPDDPETFAMLSAGDALGVFQLESSGMRELLRQIRPDRFGDLSDIVALYRPGPMGSGMMDMYIERKNGRQAVTYPHPSLEPILAETRGVVVYQEQVMRVANVLAGFELSEADNLRKAMGKKKPELLAKYREKFVTGCATRGLTEAHATEIWNQLEHFAGYGFNKSHTVAYAVVTYQTAYLKRHWPREFMAALLTCEMADMDKVTEYVEEARRMGIAVLPPDVSRSGPDFDVEGDDIRYALAAIKGVGRSAAEAIARGAKDGPYRSVFDLCERVDLHVVNGATLEALAKAGAFDATGAPRARVFAALDRAMALGATAAEDRSSGQISLFGASPGAGAPEPDYPNVPEWAPRERMAFEREAIGFYATSHPLAEHERTLRLLATSTTAEVREAPERDRVRLGGMILQPRVTVVKTGPNEGRKMAFFQIEDFAGSLECVVFSRGYAEMAPWIAADRVVIVEGRVDRAREEPSLQVDRIVPIEEAPRVLARGVLVRLERADGDALGRLRGAIGSSPGDLPVVLEFRPEEGAVARVKAGPSWAVAPTERLLPLLRALPDVAAAEYLTRDP